jgi:hypothetical protein
MEWVFAIGIILATSVPLMSIMNSLSKILAALERIERADGNHQAIMNHLGTDAARSLQQIADRNFAAD